MYLRLVREPSINGTTHGVLFLDGHFECFCLEDMIREVSGQPMATWKVSGQTAIPSGRYRIIITPSRRFERPLPLLLDVPGFTGIRIHPGNTVADTAGCLLVGMDRRAGQVLRSRVAFEALFAKLATTQGDLWIRIENPAVEEA